MINSRFIMSMQGIMKSKFLIIICLSYFIFSVFGQFNFEKDQFSNFKWGCAICEYQNSGAENCPGSNWSEWEKIKGTIHNNQRSGKSTDFWNRYESDIELMKKLGINSLRFSVSWENIEPKKGQFNEEALKHYEDLCDKLLEAGIEPMITLHHFVHPIWFEELGAFEKEENIKYFIKFCKIVFDRLSDKVKLWCTINEPTIYMLQGYIRGVFPPGKTKIFLALKVLENLMKAHVKVYYSLKKMPNGQDSQIGFVHQYLKFEPYSSWNLIERIPGLFMNKLLNDVILKFLKTGEFKINVMPPFNKHYFKLKNKDKPFDFIGLNYYSRVLVQFQWSLSEPLKPSAYPNEIMTDMPYAIYSQGLYDAIKDVSQIGVPIYITENGIADAKDDRREKFITEYTEQLLKAINDGFDVRGYYYWTFADNFEWDEGFSMKFGLFKVDFETQERTLREGSKAYQEIISNFS